MFVVFLFALLLPLSAHATCDSMVYTKLEYLEDTGGQYIDTGLSMPSGFTTELRVTFLDVNSTSLRVILGAHTSNDPYYRNFISFSDGGLSWCDQKLFLGAYHDHCGNITVQKNVPINITASTVEGACFVEQNGVLDFGDFTTGGAQRSSDNLYLFNINVPAPSNYRLAYPAYMKLFYARIYNPDGTLVRDFVPVRRRSDSVLGMCDKVTGNFFTNSGTGEFVAGPAICDAGYTLNVSTNSCETCANGTYSTGGAANLDPTIEPISYTRNETNKTWEVVTSYGTVSGLAVCNSTPGTYKGATNTDFPMATTGIYCWCKITSPATSQWVFSIEGDVGYQSDSICASDCANHCSVYIGHSEKIDYRTSIFSTTACQSCVGLPANAHWTGNGINANNCPWECDVGYGRTSNNTCEQLCTAGVTGLHTSTGLVFNLYANRQTQPSIYIQPDNSNTVCYVNLAPGVANNAVNVDYNGAIYHSID